MKFANKIAGATAMLLVSVLMLGTASFAWFAMNTNSVADGFTVEAYTDSNFLEISQTNVDADYGINTTFTQNNTGLLRLITHKRFNANEIVTIEATQARGNFTTVASDATKYYKAVKGDIAIKDDDGDVIGYAQNYIHVPMTEDDQASSTAGLYKNPTFTLVTAEGPADDTKAYFELVNNSYKLVENPQGSVKGYYTREGDPEASGSTYNGTGVYYKYENKTFTKVNGLHVGTDLSQYYTIAETAVTLTENQKGDGSTVYYLKNTLKDENGDPTGFVDYSYVGTVSSAEYVKNYIYWGRAYSNDPTAVQEDNTLSMIDKAAHADYYLQQRLYLRQAEGTNLANNLRVKDIKVGGATNDLNDALRVLLVATSTSDPTNIVTVIYDAGEDTYNGVTVTEGQETVLFSKLLGNEEETITVDVYIFFDGTDDVAMNTTMDGAVLNGQSVEIEFSIDKLDYNK